MVTNQKKPSEIQIINIQDDIRKGKTKVKYAFNYNIQEVQEEAPILDEEGKETTELRTVYKYIQLIFESEFDLFMKNAIPDALKALYKATEAEILSNISMAETELPKEINVEEG